MTSQYDTLRACDYNGDGKADLIVYNSATALAYIGTGTFTGAGAMMPPLADGQLGPLEPPFPVPVLRMSALMNNSPAPANGIPAPILFAGQAPGLIAGAVQVNVQVPASSPSGDVELTIYLDGGYQMQIGRTTIAVSR